ncbi:hypothetical protein N658DRAFT_508067 [Parathielavia hyrcaniae]|uniref:Uncharacterized protein n=1 Tax=Parathielavia hyrcaniae TaxID=113614 RepID=A0AAN6Q347_9PEZI|nr:hypothetical protein N658DRAFT_508067 [Parathielavia hyrcaniae]
MAGVAVFECYGISTPFTPVYIFRNYSTTAVYAGSFAHGLVLYSLVYFFRSFGRAVGVGIGYSILDNHLRVELPRPDVASLLPKKESGQEIVRQGSGRNDRE